MQKNFKTPVNSNKTVNWQIDNSPIHYNTALAIMEATVAEIIEQKQGDTIWLLEHLDVYTKGTSAEATDLLYNKYGIEVVDTNRGGKYTYHGLGQRVIYPMLDLNDNQDLKKYINFLQDWMIETLRAFNIDSFKKNDAIGIWVLDGAQQEKKIGAIGIRIKRWVAYHGIAININTKLNHFGGINPCGLGQDTLTSFRELNKNISFADFDEKLIETFNRLY